MPRLLHHISARYPRSPRAREWECKTTPKALILSPRCLKSWSFLQNAAHSACLSPKIQYAGALGC